MQPVAMGYLWRKLRENDAISGGKSMYDRGGCLQCSFREQHYAIFLPISSTKSGVWYVSWSEMRLFMEEFV